MGLGILEDHVMSHVPGTTRYYDDPERPQFAHGDVSHLKCDTSGPVPIILVPQPSDDPNDPLNWPLWRRDLICFILSMTAIFATALGPILASNTLYLAGGFNVPFTKIALLTGYFLLGVGFAGAFFVPSSRIWGKRHAFVLGACLLIGSSAWAGAAGHNYTSLLWARIVQGVGAAPYEALVNAAVGDLYFVHQRGKRMAFTNMAIFGGSFFTPILAGKITYAIGWRWTFYFVAIFCSVSLLAIVLFCPETAYRRDDALNLDILDKDIGEGEVKEVAESKDDNANAASSSASAPDHTATAANANANASGPGKQSDSGRDVEKNEESTPTSSTMGPPARVSWVQSLELFNGRKTDDNFFLLLLRPFPLFLQPAFLWASLTQGTLIGWTVFIGVTIGEFYGSYPLWWGETKTGYGYTGAFLGALAGFLLAGVISDRSAAYLTRRNNGVYEPEFRILLVVPQFIFGVMGVFGFGITMDGVISGKYHWSVPLVFFGFEVCGMVLGAVASSLYIVDAYRDLAIEGFTCLILFKNFFSYGLTNKAYDWLAENNNRSTPVFNALGAVQVVVCALSIPMYIWGKRNRSFFHRYDILAMLKLR